MLELAPNSHIHFIGIGGVSMSGLAHALLDQGFRVSGSDMHASERTDELAAAGATVHIGHRAESVAGADCVVYTTAIRDTNPELAAAKASGVSIAHRSEVLAYMTRGKHGVAVTGTHGKSSTTAMLATIFAETRRDPSVFVGADAPSLGGSNFRIGRGDAVIFEACESDGSFLQYTGCSQVLLNVEPEHLDQHHNMGRIRELFREFVSLADPEGFAVWWQESAELPGIVRSAPCRTVSFGLSDAAQVRGQDVELSANAVSFVPVYPSGASSRVAVRVPGRHNVLNALAALAAAVESGIDAEAAGQALERYEAIGRRFDVLGEVAGRLIVDDYAHHPTEIAATLAAARAHRDRRVVAVFQPHLYSRTQFFMSDFARALSAADAVIVTDIYAAREDPIPGVSAADVIKIIRRDHPGKSAEYIAEQADIVANLQEHSQPGDLILIMGAGDIRKAAEALAESDADAWRTCCT